MVTKWRNFTARTAVKIVSFLLILVLCFIILNMLNSCDMRHTSTGLSTDIVLANIDDNNYFFNRHMYYVRDAAFTLLMYKDEESILAGEYIKWEFSGENWHNDVVAYEYSLSHTQGHTTYAWIDDGADTPELRAEYEQKAINSQLRDFRSAKELLMNEEGLLYRIIRPDGTAMLYNAEVEADYFTQQPVYFVSKGDGVNEYSHPTDFGYSYPSEVAPDRLSEGGDASAVYLAYTREYVSGKNVEYVMVKNACIRDITIAAVAAKLILLSLIILIAGAGRRPGDVPGAVRFLLIDRIFLDIGAAMLLGWYMLCFVVAEELSWTIWYYKNVTAMIILFAACSGAFLVPTLLWLLTLTKHIKAGRFWRHTLIVSVCSEIVRFIRSLWVGFPLTVKCTLITLAAFFAMLICAGLGTTHEPVFMLVPVLVVTAAIAVLIWLYAQRIRKLEQGAKAASEGDYSANIAAGGGELGRIADSINNISAGINTAVNDRMKSERLKTELITNVSHDIRTPLTSIITYTDLLKNEGLSCPKAPEYLDVLIQKSQRLKTLTDELFEAAKAASGSIDVNIVKLDLVSLINQVLGELDGSIKASGLDLRLKMPERLDVMGDGKLMWRVLENLLSNVFKYSLPGSRVYIDAERENLFVRVDVKNISATELNVDPSELTERFKRGDEARADGGSGLGLSIVQSFMTAQGGRLTLSIDGDLFKASVFLPGA